MVEPSLSEVNKIICKLGSENSFYPVTRIDSELYDAQEEFENSTKEDNIQNTIKKIKKKKTEDSSTKFWIENYKELKAFKIKEGHCTPSYKKNPKLYSWIHRQKFQNRSKKLQKGKVKILETLGVQFDYHWDEMYNELKNLKNRNIITQIQTKEENQKLKDWLYSQLISWKNGKLSEHRIYRMKVFGFTPEMKNQFK